MKKYKSPSPFIFPLISLIAGIIIQSLYPSMAPHASIGLCASILGIFIAALCKWHTATIGGLHILFLCTGSTILSLQHLQAQKLLKMVEHQRLTIVATVSERHIQASNKPLWQQNEVLELSISDAAGDKELISKPFKLQCFVKHTTNVRVGDTILIKNIIIKSSKHKTLSGNPGYGDYLLKEGFLSSIFILNDNRIQIIKRPSWSFKRWLWEIRNTTFQDIMTQLSARTASYYSLIFLGKKDPSDIDALRRNFNAWGLSHYLARAGLHIVLFIIIWKFVLNILPAHIIIKRTLLIIICSTYGILSWASTPFIRAFYSFLISETGKLFDLDVHFFHLLTVICLLMLLFNPMHLFSLDFQLTFGLTFALGWLSLHTNQITDQKNVLQKKA